MGKAALHIVDEAAGEEAASQTVQLSVIEGGATTAGVGGVTTGVEAGAIAGTAEAGGAAAAAGIGGAAATAGLALVVVGLAALGYYIHEHPHAENPQSQPKAPKKPELETTCPLAKTTSIPDADKCPPHAWVVDPKESGTNPDDKIKELREAATRARSIGHHKEARGYDFEADAIEKNKSRGIETTDRLYRCSKCGAVQQVDILFKNGQFGECKSKKANQMKNPRVKAQSTRYVDLQRQMNELKKTSHQPLAKLDNSEELKKTVDSKGRTSREIMIKRGYEIELLPPE